MQRQPRPHDFSRRIAEWSPSEIRARDVLRILLAWLAANVPHAFAKRWPFKTWRTQLVRAPHAIRTRLQK